MIIDQSVLWSKRSLLVICEIPWITMEILPIRYLCKIVIISARPNVNKTLSRCSA